jgi:putative ABC transport system permease protein
VLAPAGENLEVSVASIRKVKWDTFQPNFFIVFVPGVLEGAAGTYMTSAYFTPGAGHSLAQLAHRFPSVSIFDIEELLTQVRAVLDKAALAVQSVFVFTLLAGLTVLLAAVQSSREERRYESAMLRTLGASRATVVQGVLAEFTTLGALAGRGGPWRVGRGLPGLPAGLTCATAQGLPWLEGVLGARFWCRRWLARHAQRHQPPLRTLRS